MYIMEQALKDTINAQRAEADEFCKTPGNWMGKYPCPSDLDYWEAAVPSGTLKEFNRTQLVNDAYYLTAEVVSKSYARSLDFANWSDRNLERHIENMLKHEETV